MTIILDAFFWFMGVASAGFLAYGAWVCFRQAATERERAERRKTKPADAWRGGAPRLS